MEIRQTDDQFPAWVQTGLLFMSIALVTVWVGWLVAGWLGILCAVLAGGLSIWTAVRTDPAAYLRIYRAEQLEYAQAPLLYDFIRVLSGRAGLREMPRLFYFPLKALTAFSAGDGNRGLIGISAPLLQFLTQRELLAVLAHEVMHLRHRDIRLLAVADGIGRYARILALVGILLALINIPLALIGSATINWWAILVLIAAPVLINMLQLALSRSREYAADLGAVMITGDAEALASALTRLEQASRPMWWRTFGIPNPRHAPHPWLSTHPPTRERVRRIRELAVRKRLPPPI